MAKHRVPGDDPSTREGVTERPDEAYWSVDDSRWPAVRPDLPAHMVDLLAPPIVVGVARVPVTSRLTPPGTHPPVPAEPRAIAPAVARAAVPAEARGTVPAEARAIAPAEARAAVPAEHRPAPATSAGPRRIVPAGPGGPGRRLAGTPTSGGRHRRTAGRPDRT
ncbi:hypothetical protein V6U77_14045 [Micromonospora sp. CPCC 205546]|uniref:hypothetical protein n=1 Tax=Micromonospora sp. CPCC 205546 TaxID=3122397 RepID=UPI002FEF0F07